jgi:hypothetical protein
MTRRRVFKAEYSLFHVFIGCTLSSSFQEHRVISIGSGFGIERHWRTICIFTLGSFILANARAGVTCIRVFRHEQLAVMLKLVRICYEREPVSKRAVGL